MHFLKMGLFLKIKTKKLQNGPKNKIDPKNGKKKYKYPIFFHISS